MAATPPRRTLAAPRATSRRVKSPRVTALRAALLGAVLLAAACTDDTSSPPTSTLPSTSVTRPPTSVAADDGILRIGVLTPESGPGQVLGEPVVQAVDLAVAEINLAGGVNGVPVEVVRADEGDSVATASKAASELVQQHVDVVIGPTSSRLALAVLDSLLDEGVVACSPTATATVLGMFPDGQRFLRTIPSDSLQGVAMAELVERAGVDSAAVLAPDDAFGQAYTDAIAAALARRGITVTAQLAYDGASDESTVGAIETALAGNPGAVAFVGNTSSGRAALSTLLSAVPAGVPVVVNDALRVAPDDEVVPTGDVDVTGTSPRPGPAPGSSWFTTTFATFLGSAPEELPPSFAAHAYDCVSLLAIAAEASGANSAAALLPRVIDVSQGGATCPNFVACRALLAEGRNIDLNGASGPLDLEANGDVSTGWFDRFLLDAEGHDVATGELLVGAF